MRSRYIRGLTLVLLALGAVTARPRAAAVADYTLGGVGCSAAPSNSPFYCFGGFGFTPFQAAVAAAANFPGTAPGTVTTVALSTFSDADLAAIDGLVVPWWSIADANPADVERIKTFFLNGGDLLILADDPFHDPVNEALGVATETAIGVGERTITGGAPVFDGPFGTVTEATQHLFVGGLDPAAVIMSGGRVVGTAATGTVTVAVWNENDYAPGAGRMVIATDVDTFVPDNAAYAPLNANGRFALNATAFLVNGGGIDAIPYDLVGVPSCDITPSNDFYCGINGVFFFTRNEAAKPQNFGPGGTFDRRVAFVEFDAFTPELAARLKAVAIPWIQEVPVNEAASYQDAVVDWFLSGGNLWLLQDDPLHDPIGALLGVPTPTAIGSERLTDGAAPTYSGPFGTATSVRQTGFVGDLDPDDVADNGGTITGTSEDGDNVVATWRENEYAPGAGRMVIATDVDMVSQASLFPENLEWALNTIAFLLSDGTAPSVSCDVSQRRLWPPNGNTTVVIASGIATDDASGLAAGAVTFTVTDEYGTSIPGGTLTLDAAGEFSVEVPLIASRLGTDLNGRLYTIDITASDTVGNVGTCTTTVVVPHDRGKS